MTPSHTRSTSTRRSTRLGAGFLLAALALAACGGGDDEAAPTTSAAPVPETTEAVTTTEATVPETTEAESTETTEGDEAEAGPVMPLTGLPIDDEIVAARPAMVVKIDNHPQARPQFGINGADIVFEENVENLTRFAAVFHTNAPAKVGPIRSGRTQDVDLLGSYTQPLFVWSGGNPNVTRAINDSDLISLSPTTTRNTGFFRDRRGNEDSEHTLYGDAGTFYEAFTPIFNPPPAQQFTYREPDEAFNGETSTGVELEMDGVDVTWTWDKKTATYLREQDGKAHETDFGQVNAVNVVVLEVDYRPSPADSRSPEAQTIGTGTAHVFTGGVLITGTWTRNDRTETFTLADENGSVIALTPGRTWVELPRVGNTVPLT
ncbi:MAG: DUF3048 domain-containing protein [Actinobacteria bacterium]|nr:DUF3048 domain-containing protein [Actinomycetota bacterium]